MEAHWIFYVGILAFILLIIWCAWSAKKDGLATVKFPSPIRKRTEAERRKPASQLSWWR